MTDRNCFNVPFILVVEDAAQRVIKAIDIKERVYNCLKRRYYLIRVAWLPPDFLRERIM